LETLPPAEASLTRNALKYSKQNKRENANLKSNEKELKTSRCESNHSSATISPLLLRCIQNVPVRAECVRPRIRSECCLMFVQVGVIHCEHMDGVGREGHEDSSK
jgi:7-keto-8-aminopelargonate synthetase-like enzyme